MSLLNWWTPKAPLAFREKAWVEMRLRWLAERFGTKRLTQCRMILPDDLDGDEPFDGSSEAARRLFERICGFMEVVPSQVALEFAPDEQMVGRAGEYDGTQKIVRVAERLLQTPDNLAATFAHELAHHILLTQFSQDLLENNGDVEWVTDLTPIIFGLGIYAANATVHDKSETSGQMHFWHISRHGYLPARMIGYAMALLIKLSEQTDIRWMQWLRGDASDTLLKSLEYLDATNDSTLRRENLDGHNPRPSIHRLIELLENGSDTERIIALWQLAAHNEQTERAVPMVANLLTDRQPDMRAEAARTLAKIGPDAEAAVTQLLHAADDWMPEVSASAIYALGRLHVQPERVITNLLDQLERQEVAETTAWALAQYGQAARSALPQLGKALVDALARNAGSIDYFVYAIRSISPHPEEELERLIDSCDIELQTQAENLIPEHSNEIPPPPGGRDWRSWLGGPV